MTAGEWWTHMSAALQLVTEPEIPAPCRDCQSRKAGVCASMSNVELTGLRRHVIRRKVAAGDALYNEGSTNSFYASVLSGVVKLTRILKDGHEQIVGLQFANDFLGQRFDGESAVTATAASDVELCKMPKAVVDRLADESRAIARRMHLQAANDLDAARGLMMTLVRKDAHEKVADLIYTIARRQSQSGANDAAFDLPLSRADIASHLGLTIETVSRQLTKLKTGGLIAIERATHLRVPDMKRLAQAAGL
jgi:CRP/FNR family transcriptional regulator